MFLTNHPGPWQVYLNRSDNKGLSLMEVKNKYMQEQLLYENYMSFQMQQQLMMSNASAGGGLLPEPTPPSPSSGDLTLVFSNFNTVDLLLAGGVDSLPDWNTALVDSGNPYTSIVVDEESFTVYLSGGSNIILTINAFTGIVEGNLGLGEDLISIVDTGTIIGSNGSTFNACYILETANLPALTNVADFDFYGCSQLKQTQLPLVTSVGQYGFFGAFNTADSPMTLNLPLCTSYGVISFLAPDGLGGYVGTTEVDSPKVMNATFSTSVQMDPEIILLLTENSGIIATYV